jgi:hypothetical protein
MKDHAHLCGVAALTLRPGQSLTVQHMRTDDVVVCKGASDAIKWKATERLRSATFVWDKTLALTITRHMAGRVTAACRHR